MTLHYWRITFSRVGLTPATYEVVGDTFEEAYELAKWKHSGGSWDGSVEYQYVGTEPTVRDLSVTLDELAERSAAVKDSLPF